MNRPRPWFDPRTEMTQTRDLPDDLLRGFAEVYRDALALVDQARTVAERYCDLFHELSERTAGEDIDDHPTWWHSGMLSAHDAVNLIAHVAESIPMCRIRIHGGHDSPCHCVKSAPEWPRTAWPLDRLGDRREGGSR